VPFFLYYFGISVLLVSIFSISITKLPFGIGSYLVWISQAALGVMVGRGVMWFMEKVIQNLF